MKRYIIAFLGFVTSLLATAQHPYLHKHSYVHMPIMGDSRSYSALSKEKQKQIDCLALNIYREAGIEKSNGKVAVALVTMNRLKAKEFPNTICNVVYQKTTRVCQFSWVCMNKLPRIDKDIYNYSKALATKVFLNYDLIEDFTGGALFYHADYVRPKWKRLQVTTKIGRHIFYKPIGEK